MYNVALMLYGTHIEQSAELEAALEDYTQQQDNALC